ncbi:MAG: UTP--glucose-1-phosphate uridylyltransferase, partial [Chlamydiae bacterium]|nr:UTP--glucose-1-phosphate uridylyltransferase [Chlamydiota bacterium]
MTSFNVNYEKSFRKFVSTLLLITFSFTYLVQDTGFAQELNTAYSVQRTADRKPADTISPKSALLEVSHGAEVSIPANLGDVIDRYEGKDDRMIIQIQDVHCHFEAQSNTAKIISDLLQKHGDHGLKMIGLEAAEGSVDTTLLTSYPDKKLRKVLAEYLMKKGKISGAEYLSIIQDKPLPLEGVENMFHYFEHLFQFDRGLDVKDKALPILDKIEKAITDLREKIYSQEVLEVLNKEKSYLEGDTQIDEYGKYLVDQALTLKLDVGGQKNFQGMMKVADLEKQIDLKKVEEERVHVLEILSRKLVKEEMVELMTKSLYYRLEKMDAWEYYEYLKTVVSPAGTIKTCRESLGVSGQNSTLEKTYPNLSKYIQMTEIFHEIKSDELLKECEKISEEVQDKLLKTKEEKALRQIEKDFIILRNFFELEMKKSEFQYYVENKERVSAKNIVDGLEEIQDPGSRVQGNSPRSPLKLRGEEKQKQEQTKSAFPILKGEEKQRWVTSPPLSLRGDGGVTNDDITFLDSHLKDLEQFYRYSDNREEAMVQNTLRKMKENESPIAILYAGGFHTDGLTKRLEEEGVSYVVVAPRITQFKLKTPYLSIIKNEPSKLEKMLMDLEKKEKGTMATLPLEGDLKTEVAALSGLEADDPARVNGEETIRLQIAALRSALIVRGLLNSDISANDITFTREGDTVTILISGIPRFQITLNSENKNNPEKLVESIVPIEVSAPTEQTSEWVGGPLRSLDGSYQALESEEIKTLKGLASKKGGYAIPSSTETFGDDEVVCRVVDYDEKKGDPVYDIFQPHSIKAYHYMAAAVPNSERPGLTRIVVYAFLPRRLDEREYAFRKRHEILESLWEYKLKKEGIAYRNRLEKNPSTPQPLWMQLGLSRDVAAHILAWGQHVLEEGWDNIEQCPFLKEEIQKLNLAQLQAIYSDETIQERNRIHNPLRKHYLSGFNDADWQRLETFENSVRDLARRLTFPSKLVQDLDNQGRGRKVLCLGAGGDYQEANFFSSRNCGVEVVKMRGDAEGDDKDFEVYEAETQEAAEERIINDILRRLQLDEGKKYDAIYARLSLHHLPQKYLLRVLRKISDMLEVGGKFYWVVKSKDDVLYQGRTGEPGEDGLTPYRDQPSGQELKRRFFTPDEMKALLEAKDDAEKTIFGFEVSTINPRFERLTRRTAPITQDNHESSLLEVVAEKKEDVALALDVPARVVRVGAKLFDGETGAQPIEPDVRPSIKGDVVDVTELSDEEGLTDEAVGARSVMAGEGCLSILAAGGSSRMAIAKMPERYKKDIGDADINSKALVPLGSYRARTITYFGAFFYNIKRLFEGLQKEAEGTNIENHLEDNDIMYLTNDTYAQEQAKHLRQNESFGLQQRIYSYVQPWVNKIYAPPDQIGPLRKNLNNEKFDAAKKRSEEIQAAFDNGDEKAVVHKEKGPWGHGEYLHQMVVSGRLLDMLEKNKKWIYVRNIDNSGAKFDRVWLRALGLFLKKGVGFMPEVSPRSPGQKGGGLLVVGGRQGIGEDAIIAATAKAKNDSTLTAENCYWFNNGAGFMTPSFVASLYMSEGQTIDAFIQELQDANGDVEKLEAVAERGRGKFLKLFDVKPTKNGEGAAPLETNLWTSSIVAPVDQLVEAVGVRGVRALIENEGMLLAYFALSWEDKIKVLEKIRFFSAKQWELPEETVEKNRRQLEENYNEALRAKWGQEKVNNPDLMQPPRRTLTREEALLVSETYEGNLQVATDMLRYIYEAPLVTPGVFREALSAAEAGASVSPNSNVFAEVKNLLVLALTAAALFVAPGPQARAALPSVEPIKSALVQKDGGQRPAARETHLTLAQLIEREGGALADLRRTRHAVYTVMAKTPQEMKTMDEQVERGEASQLREGVYTIYGYTPSQEGVLKARVARGEASVEYRTVSNPPVLSQADQALARSVEGHLATHRLYEADPAFREEVGRIWKSLSRQDRQIFAELLFVRRGDRSAKTDAVISEFAAALANPDYLMDRFKQFAYASSKAAGKVKGLIFEFKGSPTPEKSAGLYLRDRSDRENEWGFRMKVETLAARVAAAQTAAQGRAGVKVAEVKPFDWLKPVIEGKKYDAVGAGLLENGAQNNASVLVNGLRNFVMGGWLIGIIFIGALTRLLKAMRPSKPLLGSETLDSRLSRQGAASLKPAGMTNVGASSPVIPGSPLPVIPEIDGSPIIDFGDGSSPASVSQVAEVRPVVEVVRVNSSRSSGRRSRSNVIIELIYESGLGLHWGTTLYLVETRLERRMREFQESQGMTELAFAQAIQGMEKWQVKWIGRLFSISDVYRLFTSENRAALSSWVTEKKFGTDEGVSAYVQKMQGMKKEKQRIRAVRSSLPAGLAGMVERVVVAEGRGGRNSIGPCVYIKLRAGLFESYWMVIGNNLGNLSPYLHRLGSQKTRAYRLQGRDLGLGQFGDYITFFKEPGLFERVRDFARDLLLKLDLSTSDPTVAGRAAQLAGTAAIAFLYGATQSGCSRQEDDVNLESLDASQLTNFGGVNVAQYDDPSGVFRVLEEETPEGEMPQSGSINSHLFGTGLYEYETDHPDLFASPHAVMQARIGVIDLDSSKEDAGYGTTEDEAISGGGSAGMYFNFQDNSLDQLEAGGYKIYIAFSADGSLTHDEVVLKVELTDKYGDTVKRDVKTGYIYLSNVNSGLQGAWIDLREARDSDGNLLDWEPSDTARIGGVDGVQVDVFLGSINFATVSSAQKGIVIRWIGIDKSPINLIYPIEGSSAADLSIIDGVNEPSVGPNLTWDEKGRATQEWAVHFFDSDSSDAAKYYEWEIPEDKKTYDPNGTTVFEVESSELASFNVEVKEYQRDADGNILTSTDEDGTVKPLLLQSTVLNTQEIMNGKLGWSSANPRVIIDHRYLDHRGLKYWDAITLVVKKNQTTQNSITVNIRGILSEDLFPIQYNLTEDTGEGDEYTVDNNYEIAPIGTEVTVRSVVTDQYPHGSHTLTREMIMEGIINPDDYGAESFVFSATKGKEDFLYDPSGTVDVGVNDIDNTLTGFTVEYQITVPDPDNSEIPYKYYVYVEHTMNGTTEWVVTADEVARVLAKFKTDHPQIEDPASLILTEGVTLTISVVVKQSHLASGATSAHFILDGLESQERLAGVGGNLIEVIPAGNEAYTFLTNAGKTGLYVGDGITVDSQTGGIVEDFDSQTVTATFDTSNTTRGDVYIDMMIYAGGKIKMPIDTATYDVSTISKWIEVISYDFSATTTTTVAKGANTIVFKAPR